MRHHTLAFCAVFTLIGCAGADRDSSPDEAPAPPPAEAPERAQAPEPEAPKPPPPPAAVGGEIVPAPPTEVVAAPSGNTADYQGRGAKLQCVTAQGVATGLQPVAPTDAFLTSNPWVKLILWGDTPPEKGSTLGLKLFGKQADGQFKLIGPGSPVRYNGKTNRVAITLPVAGRRWAAEGGEFEARLYWGDEEAPAVVAPFTIAKAKRHALVVSIADYLPKGLTDQAPDLACLDGAADRMAQLLTAGFGFHSNDIVIVKDLDATRARLEKELLAMAERAGPDDVVLFYYTGHGGQVPDLDGDEADGWDEVLVTADKRPPLLTTKDHLNLYLTDDRLSQILSKFKTKNVTLIFDSCHSGTMTRAGETGPLWEYGEDPPQGFNHRPAVDRALVEMAEDTERPSTAAATDELDIDDGYVFISAAQSWEVAIGNKAFSGGVFSAMLRSALINGGTQRSWNEIVQGITPAIHRHWAGQSPQVHGAGDRVPFSLATGARDTDYQRPSAAITGADAEQGKMKLAGKRGEQAHLAGGQALYDEQRGVEYAVYDKDDTSFTGKVKARVTLSGERATQSKSKAKIVTGEVEAGDRAVPLTVRVPGASARFRLGFLGGVSQADVKREVNSLRALLNTLKRTSGLRFVEGGGSTDYRVLLDPRGGRIQAVVTTAGRYPIATVSGNGLAKQIADVILARHRGFARFSRIGNPSPEFGLHLSRSGGARRVTPGESFVVSASVTQPAFLWAIAGPEGGALRLVAFTNEAVKPGERFQFEVGTSGDARPWYVKVIASTRPLDVARMKRAPAAGQAGALIALLQQAHGGSGEMISTSGWAEAGLRVQLN